MLSTFPLCIKGWLEILVTDMQNINGSFSDWKTSGAIPSHKWHSKFCFFMENDSKFYIFNDESSANEIRIPAHMSQCYLDTELGNLYKNDSSCCIVNSSSTSSKIQDNDLKISNSLSKPHPKSGFPRACNSFFRQSRSNNKINEPLLPKQDYNFENNQSIKSVSDMKRTFSFSRLHRKKSDDKSMPKSSQSPIKTNVISHSTGDLATDSNSTPEIRFDLSKHSKISEVHSSLVGERLHCFSVSSFAEEMNIVSNFPKRSNSSMYVTKYFAARSNLEKQCWMKRLQQTLQPNMDNDDRISNSLRLTIYESKFLPMQKRKYYCEVSLDKSLYAKTTSKLSNGDGCVFWAEDINLNNLPNFKTLTTNLYKEPDPEKDSKKKKKKHTNQCIGQIVFNISLLNSQSEIQSWFNLRSPDFLPDLSSSSSIQLRMRLRYQSLKVLKNDAYTPLYEIVTRHYGELIPFFERNLSIKLKEEISVCLVNIHEKNGSIVQFLCDLISEEVNDLDNDSMTLRENTIVTKIIEAHMKLVGCQYLHSILHPLINEVMFKNVTVEVNPSYFGTGEYDKNSFLIVNQRTLTEYVKDIWYKIYESKDRDFPKQMKSVFIGWRNKLTSHFPTGLDTDKMAIHCDVIVSSCLFLRLLCPAILSPHLFGLVSHFSEQAAVQRTLTLIAKSLLSLANFSKFGEKEHFMTFFNSCFDEEIPRMRDFLRYISTTNSADEYDGETEVVNREIHFYGASIDLPVEMAHLHYCLVSDEAKKHMSSSSNIQNISKLPDILHNISEQLNVFNVTPSNPSFFSLKKSQAPNWTSVEPRRSSMAQLLNVNESSKSVNIASPPPTRSPRSKNRSVVDLESVYAQHSDDVWMPKPWANVALSKSVKEPVNLLTTYSTELQSNLARNTQLQVPDHDIGNHQHSNTKLPSILYRSNIDDIQLTSSFPISGLSNKLSSQFSTHNDLRKRAVVKILYGSPHNKSDDVKWQKPSEYRDTNGRRVIDVCDKDYYFENHIYDIVDTDVKRESDLLSGTRCPKIIDRYFTVRNEVTALSETIGQGTCESNDDRNEQLQSLSRELKVIKTIIHRDQLSDLRQLKEIIHLSKSGVDTETTWKSSGSRPHKSLENIQSNTADILDDVINSISIGEEGLVELQEHLRKNKLKGKSKNERRTAQPSSLMQQNLLQNSQRVTASSTDQSSHRVASSSSSNGSSMIKGMY